MTHDDALSLSMFWAGALMVFTPLITAGVVIAVVWRQRVKDARARGARQSAEVTHGQEARGQ
ncbi:MAG: hypothetical protein ABR499_07740 [Gemmatimonadaceae bacterium]